MFTEDLIGGFNPFEWLELKCPVCSTENFTSFSHALVVCDHCNAEFKVRMTGGDPGCVVDCNVSKSIIYAPAWTCLECGEKKGYPCSHGAFFPHEKPVCLENKMHTMIKEEHCSRPWKVPEGYPKSYSLVLKLNDYCSSWLTGNYNKHGLEKLSHPTQTQWEHFQKNLKIKGKLGVTYHARCIMLPSEKIHMDIPFPT